MKIPSTFASYREEGQQWYDLFSRGARDWLRHNEKVGRAVREKLPDLISNADVLGGGDNVVKVPVRFMEHCRFRTSYGGTQFCHDTVYLEGFCRFHHRALRRGEMNENGVLNERVSDQARRREINFHGIAVDETVYREDRT